LLWNEGYATPFEKILQVLHVLHGHAAPVKHGEQVLQHGWLITTGHAAPVAHGLHGHIGAQDSTGIATSCTLGRHVGQVLQGHIANAGAEIKANKPNIARYFFMCVNLLFLFNTPTNWSLCIYNLIKEKLYS